MLGAIIGSGWHETCPWSTVNRIEILHNLARWIGADVLRT